MDRRALIGLVPLRVAKAVVHGLVGLPADGASRRRYQGGRRKNLLRRGKVARPGGRRIGKQAAQIPAAGLQTAVEQDARLEGSDRLHQLLAPPVRTGVSLIREVKPEQVQLAVVGAKLPDLGVHIVQIAAEIAGLLFAGLIAPHGVEGVVVGGIIRVVPIHQRVVQADPQTLRAESVQEFPHQVPACGGVGGLVVRISRVKEAESLVVLCGQHRVLHPCPFGVPGPGSRIEVRGTEKVEVFPVGLRRNAVNAGVPLAFAGLGR